MSRILIAAAWLTAVALFTAAALSSPVAWAEEPAKADPAASAGPAAVAGTWAITVETSAGTGTPTVVIEQDGGKLSGTYKGRFGDQPLAGTVAGNAVRFTFTISGPMGSADVTYAGTVDGDVMQGTMQMGSQMDGRFTGRRQ